MTEATPKDYWIAPDAIFFSFNAMGSPDYLQVSCVSGAQILVYVKGIIDYDAGHNYRRWTLQSSPTLFNTHTNKYVYVAIPRNHESKNVATIVFPSQRIDIYGKDADGQQIGSEKFYYIFLQGIVSSSGENGTIMRDWLIDETGQHIVQTGFLSSDEAIAAGPSDTDWYQYSNVSQIVTFIKDITMKVGTKFQQLFTRALTIVQGGSISFDGKDGSVTGIADDNTEVSSDTDIATPKYVDTHALSKMHDDVTPFSLSMKDLQVNGQADVFGNTVLHGDVAIGTLNQSASAVVFGDFSVGQYINGVNGANVDFYGNAEFESIVARTFLNVPELRFNRTTITVGNRWQTQGAGIVEKVWLRDSISWLSQYEGVAKLKLEDGEIGAIAVDDKCQGAFHFLNKKNAVTSTDTKDGNFNFAGFTTVYFVIKEIYTDKTIPDEIKTIVEANHDVVGENQYFRYELRAAACASLPAEDRNRWTDASHPQPTMSFACYANEMNADRQSSRLTTTTYQLHLGGMTGWTYTSDNIRLVIGYLDGFSVLEKVWNKDTKQFEQAVKEFHGEGIAIGNLYMWGSIDQFDRAPSLIAQQLYFKSSGNISAPPGIIIQDNHSTFDINGWQREPITPSASNRFVWQQWLYRYSDDTYSVGDVTFQASDPTALTAVLDKNIISVAISDWYDVDNPDAISFDLTARVLSAKTPLIISGAIAELEPGYAGESINYISSISEDGLSVDFHVTIDGFVGVSIDGDVPKDSFFHVTLTTQYGDATATATIAQNRDGEDGQNGQDGKDGQDGKPGTDGISVRRSEWEVGVLYRNDSDDTGIDGARYLDEVSVTDLSAGTAKWFLARPAHNGVTSSEVNKPTDGGNDFWQPINDMRPLRTSFADIMTAFVEYLQVNRIVLTDPDTTLPYGAFGAGQAYPLWFGGTSPTNAVTRFDRQGGLRLGNNFSINGGLLRTSGNGCKVEMHDGLIEMYGAYDFPNITIGVDGDGCAILNFFDKDGNQMYNLGPSGLNKIKTFEATMTERLYKLIDVSNATKVYLQVKNITSRDTNAYYLFSPKYTITDTAKVYWYGGTSSNNPPSQTGCFYISDALSQDLPTGDFIPDGWYAKVNNGYYSEKPVPSTPTGEDPGYVVYYVLLEHFVAGKLVATGEIDWKQDKYGRIYDEVLIDVE